MVYQLAIIHKMWDLKDHIAIQKTDSHANKITVLIAIWKTDIYALRQMEFLLLIQRTAYLMTIKHAFKIKVNFATSRALKHGVISKTKRNFVLQLMESLAINSYLVGILLSITLLCLLIIYKVQKKVSTATQMMVFSAIRTMGLCVINNQGICVQHLMELTLPL